MKNINTINERSATTRSHEDEKAELKEIIREKLENNSGYGDEADMLAELWLHLRNHGIESDEDLLFTGHTAAREEAPRTETFAVTAEEYAQALTYHSGETPLQYVDWDAEGTPTVSVYDRTRLESIPDNITTKYRAAPGHTIDDALIAQFDVSDWV